MPSHKHRANLLRMIIVLTCLFVIAQVALLIITNYVTGLVDIVRIAMTPELVFSRSVFPSLVGFVAGQLVVYAAFIYLSWFVITSVCELLSLGYFLQYFVCLLLWLTSIVTILALNVYYVPHSLFTFIIRYHFLNDLLTDDHFSLILIISGMICLIAVALAGLNILIRLLQGRHLIRYITFSTLVFVAFLYIKGFSLFEPVKPKTETRVASLPNIFIIGFDALRPDFLGFFNPHYFTPHFDKFLKSSIVFNEAYTPTARTLPAWMSILTGQYPLNDGIRENNTKLNDYSTKTLASLLKQAGYETIYATDDRRFNNIDKTIGFDHVVGPSGSVSDYLIGTINDFPLSNLIIPTPIGKKLFPYNYANHGAAHTYEPQNFLEQIKSVLNQTDHRPIFLSVHFNLSGWPFYWFNDKVPYDADDLTYYRNAINGDDKLLGDFLGLLKEKELLEHAVVVLLSDHGITLALHGDRSIAEADYQGKKTEMKVKRTRYADAANVKLDLQKLNKQSDGFNVVFDEKTKSLFNVRDYGIDTSYGYGSDVLSLKQYRALLAIKAYGIDLGEPHLVSGPSMLLDIAPTLLDLLNLPSLEKSQGISLKPYLYNSDMRLSTYRPVYLETAYSVAEIEQRSIIIASVLAKSLKYYYIDAKNGSVSLAPQLLKLLIDNKQRAILQGDWLLAFYPASERFLFLPKQAASQESNLEIESHIISPYFVLVNLKNGQWTTETDQPMITKSPIEELKQQLFNFYGKEMNVYLP